MIDCGEDEHWADTQTTPRLNKKSLGEKKAENVINDPPTDCIPNPERRRVENKYPPCVDVNQASTSM
jgi:hypothetical protein